MMMSKRQGGFSLIELMIVVMILAILATIAVASFSRMSRRVHASEAYRVLGTIQAQQESYKSEFGQFCDVSSASHDGRSGAAAAQWPNTAPGLTPTQWASGLPAEWTLLGVRDLGLVYFRYDTVAGLPGVTPSFGEDLGRDLAEEDFSADVEQVRGLVAQEVGSYLTDRRVQSVAPTVVALRARAAEFVDAELARLEQRLPDVDAAVRDQVQREVRSTVHRVVEKLLHIPTVRVKELAGRSDGGSYAAALRELFDLDPAAAESVAAVRQPPPEGGVQR